jgi:hypothetical protein
MNPKFGKWVKNNTKLLILICWVVTVLNYWRDLSEANSTVMYSLLPYLAVIVTLSFIVYYRLVKRKE